MNIQVDAARTINELETLAEFSDSPAPAVTRVVFSKRDQEARAQTERSPVHQPSWKR